MPLASLCFWTRSLGFWFCLCCLASSGPSPGRFVVWDLSFHTASMVSFRSTVGRKVVECVSEADCWTSGPQRPRGHPPLCCPGAHLRTSAAHLLTLAQPSVSLPGCSDSPACPQPGPFAPWILPACQLSSGLTSVLSMVSCISCNHSAFAPTPYPFTPDPLTCPGRPCCGVLSVPRCIKLLVKVTKLCTCMTRAYS